MTGIFGSALAAICCATPLLAIGLGAIGLSACLASSDYIPNPAFHHRSLSGRAGALSAAGLLPVRTPMIDQSVMTCPRCGTAKTEGMPTDACQISYECTGCGMKLRPKSGGCCGFCSP